jgi:hypothetical protein
MIVACDGAPNGINHALAVYDVVEKISRMIKVPAAEFQRNIG